jgi:hypothetical protein
VVSDVALSVWANNIKKDADRVNSLNEVIQEQQALIQELLDRVLNRNASPGA